MKVLVYVLSSHLHPYGQMIQTSMETWDRDYVQGVETKFYCGYPIINTERIVSVPIEEGYENTGYKDIEAFKRALQWDWDFMARPNASCYVHKERLREYCSTLPKERVVRGILADASPQSRVNRPFLWGGAQMIFSRDVVEGIIANETKFRHDLIEDVALGELVQDMGITIEPMPSCSINKGPSDWTLISYGGGESKSGSFEDIIRDTPHFFFRVKHDPDRTVDAQVMHLLKSYL